jgi:hypothetical protein
MSPTYSESNLSFNLKNMETVQKMILSLKDKDIVSKAEKDLLKSAISVLSEEEAETIASDVAEVEAKSDVVEIEPTAEVVEPTAEELEAQANAEKEEKELSERVAKLSEVERKFEEQSRELAEIKSQVKTEKMNAIISNVMLSENNPVGFVADFKPTIEKFLSDLSVDKAQEFAELVKNIKSIDLSAKGSSSQESISDGDLLSKRAKELAQKDGISYREAIIKLS